MNLYWGSDTFLDEATNMLSDTFLDDATGFHWLRLPLPPMLGAHMY